MAFRRRRDEWDDFLKRHKDALLECGIPDDIVANKLRFFIFLDHGFDQWDWVKNRHDFFDARFLTDEQIARLADLVGTHIDESYRVIVGSRWQRAW